MIYTDIPFWLFGDDSEGEQFLDKFETAKTEGNRCFMDKDDYVSLLSYCLRSNNIELVEDIISDIEHFYSEDSYLKALSAYHYVIMGQVDKAELILSSIDESTQMEPMVIIGDLYKMMEKYDEGIEWFDKVLEVEEESEMKAYAMMNISEMYGELGEYDKSIDYMKHVFEGESEDVETAELLVSLFVESNMVDSGIEYFKGYVDDNPYSKIGWMSLGRLYNENGNNKDALEALDYSIAIDEKFAMSYFFKGCVLTDLGNVDEAIKHFNMVMEYDPNDAKDFSVFYNLGRCYMLKADYLEAITYFKKAIDSGVPEDENSIYIECARLMTYLGKHAEAFEYIKIATDLEPENTAFMMVKAEWQFRVGEIDKSIELLKSIIDIDNTLPMPFIKLSEMYELQEEYDNAITILMEGLVNSQYVVPLLYRLGALIAIHVSDEKGIEILRAAYSEEPDYMNELLKLYPEIEELVKNKVMVEDL